MTVSQINIDVEELQNTIIYWLQSRIKKEELQWLKKQSQQLIDDAEDWLFFTSFSAAPRHTGKKSLVLTKKEKKEVEKIRPGWTLEHWSADQLARSLLILSITGNDEEIFLDKLDKTFISSDIGEAIALYQSLPILPYPKKLRKRAAEGIRSNMTSIFNAGALRNPYPAEYFDEDAWNQLVLKALFVESPLYLIQGIDQRANKKLASMLVDYAHERWAAERSVSPELWRSVGFFAEEDFIDDLKKVINHPNQIQQYAAILALSASQSPEAKKVVKKHSSLLNEVEENNITWDVIGRNINNN